MTLALRQGFSVLFEMGQPAQDHLRMSAGKAPAVRNVLEVMAAQDIHRQVACPGPPRSMRPLCPAKRGALPGALSSITPPNMPVG